MSTAERSAHTPRRRTSRRCSASAASGDALTIASSAVFPSVGSASSRMMGSASRPIVFSSLGVCCALRGASLQDPKNACSRVAGQWVGCRLRWSRFLHGCRFFWFRWFRSSTREPWPISARKLRRGLGSGRTTSSGRGDGGIVARCPHQYLLMSTFSRLAGVAHRAGVCEREKLRIVTARAARAD